MTQLEILNFAYDGALNRWVLLQKNIAEYPNEANKAWERQAYDDLQKITALLEEERGKGGELNAED